MVSQRLTHRAVSSRMTGGVKWGFFANNRPAFPKDAKRSFYYFFGGDGGTTSAGLTQLILKGPTPCA
jgi:hypothetical protein